MYAWFDFVLEVALAGIYSRPENSRMGLMRHMGKRIYFCGLWALAAMFLSGCDGIVGIFQEHQQASVLEKNISDAAKRSIVIYDMHVHPRNGLTPEMAIAREKSTGIKVAVIANHGRGWNIDNDEKLLAFLEKMKKPTVDGKHLLVGVQVNDRDWPSRISPKVLEKFDYVLADALIMKNDDGSFTKLWKVKNIENPQKWMEKFFAHNMKILDEPITIFSNPTYLPKCLANQYDELWTDERIEALVKKAVEKGIVLEIQAQCRFQANPRFMQIAKKHGAKFSFASNNKGTEEVCLDSWFEAIRLGDLNGADIWTPPPRN